MTTPTPPPASQPRIDRTNVIFRAIIDFTTKSGFGMEDAIAAIIAESDRHNAAQLAAALKERDEARRRNAELIELAYTQSADPAARIFAKPYRSLCEEMEKAAEFWRGQYAGLPADKLESLAVMRAVCRGQDMQEMEALRAQLRTAEEAKGDLDALRELHDSSVREAYKLLGIEDDGELRMKWVLLELTKLKQSAPTPQKVPTGEGGDWLVATWQEEADAFRSWWEAHSSKLAHQATAAIAIAAFKAGRASGLSAPPATASAAQGGES